MYQLDTCDIQALSNYANRVQLTKILTRLIEVPTYLEAEMLCNLPFETDFNGRKISTFCGSQTPDADVSLSHSAPVEVLLDPACEWPQGKLTRVYPLFLKKLLIRNIQLATGNSSHLNRLIEKLADFPQSEKLKVVLWGAGEIGEALYEYIHGRVNIDVVSWVDIRAELADFKVNDIVIERPEALLEQEYDVLVIASYAFRESIQNEYRSLCECKGKKPKKIIS